ncbi:uncharacterized protein DUF981 [Blastococcus xanthinilyticus]|uniref:Uncharacterized protein DUF981 n=2 Tax=Blastococcus xanthinilyticus TaxID=1564164 RepID=A0A5S5CVP9_9ACTN|nr:uncharacterized protein DUF981 [Blastococcus xanthinilyticus]
MVPSGAAVRSDVGRATGTRDATIHRGRPAGRRTVHPADLRFPPVAARLARPAAGQTLPVGFRDGARRLPWWTVTGGHTPPRRTRTLTIDWNQLPTYNTIMSVAAGAGLLLVALLGRQLLKDPCDVRLDGYALAFGVLGVILTLTGAHMTLTWPLAPTFPFDNIIFGEPALAFGVLMLGAAVHLWRRGRVLLESADPVAGFARDYLPLSVFVVGMGLGAFGIAVAGVNYTVFAAPPAEPIAGEFADAPMLEAVFISGPTSWWASARCSSRWCCAPAGWAR